ncbi:hypothetical protein TNCV_781551 [Trichonephila clavipes]|nr:hypothetical protein TNCV_781551 [Trichonephila clavipes]
MLNKATHIQISPQAQADCTPSICEPYLMIPPSQAASEAATTVNHNKVTNALNERLYKQISQRSRLSQH